MSALRRPEPVCEMELTDDIDRISAQIQQCETILVRVREVKTKMRDLLCLVRKFKVSRRN